MNPEHLRPIGDNVLIRLDPPEETSRGGLILPDTKRSSSTSGTVVAVGSGWRPVKKVQPIPLAVGDRVIINRYGGQTVDGEKRFRTEDDGVGYVLVSTWVVLAVIEDDTQADHSPVEAVHTPGVGWTLPEHAP